MSRENSVDAGGEIRSMIEISWNREKANEIADARRKFGDYTAQGWLAFVTTFGNRKAQIYEFDPAVEKIFLVPVAEGG
jgi:hypothetical protein